MSAQPTEDQLPAKQPLSRLIALIARNVHEERQDQRFCFILGSGASKPSGIPTADELAKRWLEELKMELTPEEIQQWADTVGLNETNLAEKYSAIYEKRFELDPDEGYSYLEKVMDTIEPSWGYSVLAQVLAKTNHNVVITTNFDYLIEDALYTYANRKPLVCGHESLSGFIKPYSKRPIIAKIHRDLLMAPKSTGVEIAELPETWSNTLEGIFRFYTPIVIGYGGNDGSLMNLLEKTTNLNHGIFWCCREPNKLSERIKKLVTKLNGYIVPIYGFDEMMLLLNNQLDYELLGDEILKIANHKRDDYLEQIDNIKNNIKIKDTKAKDELIKQIDSDLEGWRQYRSRAESENEAKVQEEIYKEGLEKFPTSNELKISYADFLVAVEENFEKAEELYKEVLKSDPDNTDCLISYASFLINVRKKYDEAEEIYIHILQLDSSESSYYVSYADFLSIIKNNFDSAEELYKKAIELEPLERIAFVNYAEFLTKFRESFDEAERMYSIALDIDPDDRKTLTSVAKFYREIRKDIVKAEFYEKKLSNLND